VVTDIQEHEEIQVLQESLAKMGELVEQDHEVNQEIEEQLDPQDELELLVFQDEKEDVEVEVQQELLERKDTLEIQVHLEMAVLKGSEESPDNRVKLAEQESKEHPV
jgi:hypothetical protein